jgi:DNA-binding beta-propeller fold protein YncE
VQGKDPGQLNNPGALAIDAHSNVFIADSGNDSIDKFTIDGHPLLSFKDSVPRDLNRIAVDSGGGIYAASPRLNTIYIYSPAGELFRTVPLKAPQYERIRNIVVGEDGGIVVIESNGRSNQNEMQKYTPTGRLLRSWRLRVQSGTTAPVPASIGIGNDLSVYVVDATGELLQKFTPDGEFVSEWKWKSADPPSSVPPADGATTAPSAASQGAIASSASTVFGSGIGVTLGGIVVADPDIRGVRVWGLDGRQKLTDTLDGKLKDSSDFQIVAGPGGELLVLDTTNTRLYRFHMHF